MNLFIDPSEQIEIKFAVATKKSGQVVVDESREALIEYHLDAGDEANGPVEDHTAVFKRPAFGDMVDITGKINTSDGVTVNFSPYAIRFQRMASLLKRWTFTDGEKELPATAENLAKLHPVVANFIGVRLDAEIGGF